MKNAGLCINYNIGMEDALAMQISLLSSRRMPSPQHALFSWIRQKTLGVHDYSSAHAHSTDKMMCRV